LVPRIAASLLILAAVTASGWAQVPAGPEFRVNTYMTDTQMRPIVSSDAGGDFVVTWAGFLQDGSGQGIFAQRFDAAGAPRGGEFRVNAYTTFNQTFPVIALDARGGFVVVWGSPHDGSVTGVFGRRHDAAGAPRGAEFRVNTYTTSDQFSPAVASDPRGNFVVAWVSSGQDGSKRGVFAQRFDAAGAPRGSEFRVNTFTVGRQLLPDVAVDPGGNFVVTWESYQGGDAFDVFAQRYDAAGAPRGPEFRVNTFTTDSQSYPAVASDGSGNLVVAWQSYQDGSDLGVFAQRYDAAGVPRGQEFRVNSYTTGRQYAAAVASDAMGDFVVAWASDAQDGSSQGVFAQRYDAAGVPRGAEFRVNTYTTGLQSRPSVASDTAGNWVVAWQGLGSQSFSDVFAQRFGGLHPQALAADPVAGAGSDGNGVLEPGESAVALQPTWRNVNGAAQTFGGMLLDFGGPPGPGYGLEDSLASYDTVSDGASARCTDCYAVSVSDPAQRPATHWDAFTNETITPDAHGQRQRWLVHIGDSFTDVPRSSLFYRFIETLLHRGVTSGCSGTAYCPSSSTTREEMAVFVLAAKEGAGYVPPACAPPNIYGDVPETSPFCGYIEELSHRGVAGGCGGGNFCPADPVTREQMAVLVLRTLDPALDPPACTTPVFTDVPASSLFCRWIEELARRGVVGGCDGGRYCPADPATREQAGVFLGVTFGLTLYGI
jgi:hypothetical protein